MRARTSLVGCRVGIVYDGLFPWTGGGCERWYRELAEDLVRAGASVTYLTRQQWPASEPPEIEGVDVVAIAPFEPLYRIDGRRRMGQPLRFGAGVFRYLRRHRDDFDVVHTANFSYFSLLASRAALVRGRTALFVDWHEVWPAEFWRTYVGRVLGPIGAVVQRVCIALTPHAFVFWDHIGGRLRAAGYRRDMTTLAGLLPADHRVGSPRLEAPEQPMVLFAGRFVGDKGVRILPAILAEALRTNPTLTLVAVGEGPERDAVAAEMARLGLDEQARLPGWVSDEELIELLSSASCVIVPSIREGYGIIAVEATSGGTPIVVAANPENLAAHHVAEGVNGFAVHATPEAIAAGISKVIAAGSELRKTTRVWYEERADSMSMLHSTAQVFAQYQAVRVQGT